MRFAVPPDLDLQPLGQRIRYGSANSVQASGFLIPSAAELASGVQDRKNDLRRRNSHLVHAGWYTPGVVPYGNRMILLYDHVDSRAMLSQMLVHSIVNNLPYEMMQSGCARTADIH